MVLNPSAQLQGRTPGAWRAVTREASAPQSCQPFTSTPQTRQQLPCLQLHISAAQMGRQGWILGHALSLPDPHTTLKAAALTSRAGSPRQPLRPRPRAAAPVPAGHRPVPPLQLGQWHWLLVCGCKAQGACQKGFPPRFSPSASFSVAFTDAGLHPLGKHSMSTKGTCILLVPPVSSKDRAPLGRAGALCSNWTSKGKTLIPKMLLNHIKLHPQRQLRSTL